MRLQRFLAFLSVIFVPLICFAQLDTGFEVITMKNGDYHHGTVAHERFILATDYGRVIIPYLMMAELYTDEHNEEDRIVTVFGDIFTGSLDAGEIIILRHDQPLLPLHTDDIKDIKFNLHHFRKSRKHTTDAIELHTGDRFLANIKLGDLLLKSNTGIQQISYKDIHLIDFSTVIDSDVIKIQVTLNNGHILQGELMSPQQIALSTRYGQELTIPLNKVSLMAYKVNFQSGQPVKNYRQHIMSATVLRDEMADGVAGPELVILRGGEFQKGDMKGNGDMDEKPVVSNKLNAFAVAIYETTFAEYDRFCQDTHRQKPDDSGWGRGHRPVINVSWNDAVAYTEWLSRKTRKTYRLPSDSEWEYAARAGTHTQFWWGDEINIARANCEGCGSLWDGEKTAPVGRFLPNAFGLHDTAGNVFEWVADCFHANFSAAPIDGTFVDKAGCGKRVIRGGAWSFPAQEIRSANRWRDFPSRKSDDTGFRVVRELD